MKLKLFTFAFDHAKGCFEDSAMQTFLADKEALSFTEHFFVYEDTPIWAVMVSYREAVRDGARWPPREGRDWRGELDPTQSALFDALREWRARAARRDGVAPYLIFNNRQMAEISRRRPVTLTALGEVEGIGEGKLKRWGPEILATLGSLPPVPVAPAAAASPAGQEPSGGK